MSSKCPSCEKTVYFAEKVTSLGKDWHRPCLRCGRCKKTLAPGSHAEHDGQPYCHTPCYATLFGPHGVKYDTSLGSNSPVYSAPKAGDWRASVPKAPEKTGCISTVSGEKDLCAGCNKKVYFAEKVSSLGRDWHRPCLRCEKCRKTLVPGSHAEHGGQPYCHTPCYATLFGPHGMKYDTTLVSSSPVYSESAPKAGDWKASVPKAPEKPDRIRTVSGENNLCAGCNKKVYFAEKVSSLGRDWHRPCLRCEKCRKTLVPGSHAEHGGQPYCHTPCYATLFGPHGVKYDTSLVSSSPVPSTQAADWRASVPKAPERPGCFSTVSGENNLCARCKKKLYFAEKVSSLGRDWHRLCLRCEKCRKTLVPGCHAEHDGQPYCHTPCYATLFGPHGVKYDTSLSPVPSAQAGDWRASVPKAPEKPDRIRTVSGEKDLCAGCNKKVYFAEKVSSLGRDWHRPCLRCEKCRKTLVPGSHAEHGGQPYCHTPCYATLFGPHGVKYDTSLVSSSPVLSTQAGDWRASVPKAPEKPGCISTVSGEKDLCARCNKKVYFAEKVSSLGRDWHRPCLCCEKCRKTLVPGCHADHDGQPYCHTPCYATLFGPHGVKYDTSLSPVPSTQAGDWRASVPKAPEKPGCITVSGEKDLCARCNKKLYFAEKVSSLGRDWHRLCLRCEKCRKTLVPGCHAEHGGQPYCHRPCYADLR